MFTSKGASEKLGRPNGFIVVEETSESVARLSEVVKHANGIIFVTHYHKMSTI